MNSDQKDFETKKQVLLEKFQSESEDLDDESRDRAFEKLCVDLLMIQRGASELSSEELNKLTKFAKEKMSEMECEDPRLAHAVNGLNKIGKSRYGDASKYIEELEKAKKEAFSKVQSKHASTPKKDQLNELITSYLRFTPDMTEKEVLGRLKGAIGNGVVDEIDGEEIYYFIDDHADKMPTNDHADKMPTRTKISGLKNRVSRLKKLL